MTHARRYCARVFSDAELALIRTLIAEHDPPLNRAALSRVVCERLHWRKPDGGLQVAWTELGAQRIGVIQSLLVTCRLQGVDPYTYLVDVLQRVAEHPAKRVTELTPRVWKTMFADHPLRSDLARTRAPPMKQPSPARTP